MKHCAGRTPDVPSVTHPHTVLASAGEGGREARRRLASQDPQERAEAWLQNARAPRPSKVDVEQAALRAVTTGELACKRCRKWTGDPRKEKFHEGNDLTELQPTKYLRIRAPPPTASLGLPSGHRVPNVTEMSPTPRAVCSFC